MQPLPLDNFGASGVETDVALTADGERIECIEGPRMDFLQEEVATPAPVSWSRLMPPIAKRGLPPSARHRNVGSRGSTHTHLGQMSGSA
mmetsp:Transcript_94384/g.167187  ORF Transcript_94384/g.167187 Transcript_94384/m.167187 type:complete len:89 (-) Transcript_94384:13-279(-)